MFLFSIDLSAERIVDPRSRIYFEEVSRSYANHCYRSAIVMLWSVVVCDLIYKLQSLRDLHNDTKAGNLLNDVEAKRSVNPNSPDWEAFLLDEVLTRTEILEPPEHAQLKHLQTLRHLSAHPVLSAADLLFRPTKEDTRAQIRIALDALLLKPPLFSKRVVNALVQDIADNKELLISRDKLKTYLEARYLRNMRVEIELEIVRALWKFCFRLEDANTIAHRAINTEALAVLYRRNSAAIQEMITQAPDHFSDVGPSADALDALVDLLGEFPELHASLSSSAHILIDGRVDANINNLLNARFNYPDPEEHIQAVAAKPATELEELADGTWGSFLRGASDDGLIDDAVRVAIRVYGESGSYDAADKRFSSLVLPALPYLSSVTAEELLGAIDTNSQTYGRSRAYSDHPLVKEAAEALGVDTAAYENV